jgi:hypothetical protein
VLVGIVTTVTLVVGGAIALTAHRAFRHAESSPLRLVSYGFGLIAVGLTVGGALMFPLGVGAGEALLVQDPLVAGGLALLARSLLDARPTDS